MVTVVLLFHSIKSSRANSQNRVIADGPPDRQLSQFQSNQTISLQRKVPLVSLGWDFGGQGRYITTRRSYSSCGEPQGIYAI